MITTREVGSVEFSAEIKRSDDGRVLPTVSFLKVSVVPRANDYGIEVSVLAMPDAASPEVSPR